MADIIQAEPSQYNLDKSASKVRAQFRDPYLILLVVLAIISFITAIALFVFTRVSPAATPPILGNQTFSYLPVVFGILAIGLYIGAIWRGLNNVSLQPRAGCPSCQQKELMRISRRRSDRLITLSGIRVARYQCRECRWNGLRVFKTNYRPLSQSQIAELDMAYVQPLVLPRSRPVVKPIVEQPLTETTKPDEEFIGPEIEASISAVETAEMDMIEPNEIVLETSISEEVDSSTPDTTTLDVPAFDVSPAELPLEDDQDASSKEPEPTAEAVEVKRDPTPIWGEKAKIATTFGINLKEEPRTNSRWVGLLGPETVVSLHKRMEQSDGSIWFYVHAGAQSGWVESSSLEPTI